MMNWDQAPHCLMYSVLQEKEDRRKNVLSKNRLPLPDGCHQIQAPSSSLLQDPGLDDYLHIGYSSPMVVVEVKVSVALFHVRRNESPWKAESVSSPPESADADPRNTVWSHIFAGRQEDHPQEDRRLMQADKASFPPFLPR